MSFPRTLIGLLFGTLLLAGCASTPDDGSAPAELLDLDETVELDRRWSEGVGDGQGERYKRLIPALLGDLIIAASSDGEVVALTTDEGDELWSRDLDEEILGGVGSGDGLVLIGTRSGALIALDALSGETRWQQSLDAEVLAPAAAANGRVVVLAGDGRIFGLSADDGHVVWEFTDQQPALTLRGTSSPLLYRGTAFVGTASGKVLALNQDNGTLLWDARVGIAQGRSDIERLIDVDAPLLIQGDVLYAVAYQGSVTAIEPRTGRLLWQQEASSHQAMAAGFGNLYVATSEGHLLAFGLNGQGVHWEQSQFRRRGLSGVAVLSSYVAVADFEGYIHLLTQSEGRVVGRYHADSDGVLAPLLSDGKQLFVFGNSGDLEALELETP